MWKWRLQCGSCISSGSVARSLRAVNREDSGKYTYYLNRKYDICFCLSQSEDLNTIVLFVNTYFMKVYERACNED